MGHLFGGLIHTQFGNGTTTNSLVPVKVGGGVTTWASVDAAVRHTCGVTTAGAAYCWGGNDGGQLGDGTETQSPVPTKVGGNW